MRWAHPAEQRLPLPVLWETGAGHSALERGAHKQSGREVTQAGSGFLPQACGVAVGELISAFLNSLPTPGKGR